MNLVVWFARSISYIVVSLPRSWQMCLGDVIGIFWFDLLRIRRRLVIENIARAFPEMSLVDRVRLGRKSMCHQGRTLIEYCYFPFLNQGDLERLFVIKGLDKVAEARKRGIGVCLMTCHVGAGDFATAGLSLSGLPIHLISKEFKWEWLNQTWFNLRSRVGTRFIKPRNSSFEIMRALKANEVVIFVQDQFMGPPIGAKTTFFGIETGSALGLSVIGRKTQAPILPVHTYRRSDGVTVVEIDDPIPWEDRGEKDATLVHMTQVFNDRIEQMVRQHPDQWMWLHRRWKRFKY
ncbi:MAG: hypothetical protein IT288_10455 [Bdellovibrionales bacterium]|nr:hypothetical protein [Bdellovibrionales bacterium]